MDDNLLRGLAGAESWSVTYDGEVYEDARNWLGIWYFRSSPGEKFYRFMLQDNVNPVCKNPTRKQRPA